MSETSQYTHYFVYYTLLKSIGISYKLPHACYELGTKPFALVPTLS